MKKVTGFLFFISMLLTACTNKIGFVEEGPFVKLELYSASQGTYLDHFPKIMTISNNGEVSLFTKEVVSKSGRIEMKVEDDVPYVEKKISTDEVQKIKKTIEEKHFFSLPRDVTDYDVMDGSGSRITVYSNEKEKTVGGENTDNERYMAIRKILFKQVKEEYADWVKETEEYLFELNE